MESDLEIWEMAKIFGKWLRCMLHGLSFWETAHLSRSVGNISTMWGNDLIICQTS